MTVWVFAVAARAANSHRYALLLIQDFSSVWIRIRINFRIRIWWQKVAKFHSYIFYVFIYKNKKLLYIYPQAST